VKVDAALVVSARILQVIGEPGDGGKLVPGLRIDIGEAERGLISVFDPTRISALLRGLDLHQRNRLDRILIFDRILMNSRSHAYEVSYLDKRRNPMADAANPFEAIQAMMLENLERVQSATQSYMDTFEKAMRGVPGANDDQITTFKAYVERKVAANRDFAEKLLRAKDFQEAFRIQVEYFQSQLKAAAEDAHQLGTKMASSLKAG